MDMRNITTQSATCAAKLIRDKAGALMSADFKEYIEPFGVQNYFSVAYEQYQIVLILSSMTHHILHFSLL